MTATTWPEVLGALVARRRPDRRRRPPGRWARSSPARPPRPRSPASRWRCGPRARPSTRSPAWSTRCTPHATPLVGARPAARRRRHRRRPVDVGQHLHDGRDRRRRRRGPGRQARQPRRPRRKSGSRRRARGARHPARPARRTGSPRWPRRPASPSASPPPSTRRCGTPPCPRRELGIATTFNFLGPLANPARPAAQAIGCADPRMAPVMAGVFAAPRRRRLGLPRRRRPRRADHHDDLAGVGGRTTARSRTATVDPRDLGHRRRHRPRPCAAATRRYNADVVRRLLGGRAGRRSATPCCSTPAPRWRCTTRRSAPVDGRAGRRRSRGPARPSTPVPRAATLDRWVAASAG